VVIATPAAVAARVIGAGAAAEGLGKVQTASVALLTAALTGDLPAGLNGFLVPRAEGRLMTACSFGSNKWPHWCEPGGALVRVSAGRHGQEEALDLDDETLERRLLGELEQALGRSLSVEATRVSRWPGAFPQYLPGHAKLVTTIEDSLKADLPRVVLAGSSYRGSGIPACITSGRRAAALALPRSESAERA
jgi:oxygen-dependent protoporphyrinogen oxidase